MKLGLSGRLTAAFIRSPLTPLILMAAVAMGLLALMSIPREEEPQISVPMIDIIAPVPGLAAQDAVELVGEPLEEIVRAIPDVEHVYTFADDDQVMVVASSDTGARLSERRRLESTAQQPGVVPAHSTSPSTRSTSVAGMRVVPPIRTVRILPSLHHRRTVSLWTPIAEPNSA